MKCKLIGLIGTLLGAVVLAAAVSHDFAAMGWSASGGAELAYTPLANCPEIKGVAGGKGYGGLKYKLRTPIALDKAKRNDALSVEIYQTFSRGLRVQLQTDQGTFYRSVKLPRNRWTAVRLPLEMAEWKCAARKHPSSWGNLQSITIYNRSCRKPGHRILVKKLAIQYQGKTPLTFAAPEVKFSSAVVNYGVGGASSGELIRYVLPKILKAQPALAIVMVGTNDMINTKKMVTPQQYEANLRTIVKRLHKVGAKVLLMTIPCCDESLVLKRHNPAKFGTQLPNARLQAANAVVRQVARDTNCPLVDFYAIIAADPAKYLRSLANSGAADGVHPTPEAYRKLGDLLLKTIKENKLPISRIGCIGDSITYGAGMYGAGTAQGECYPGVLAALLAGNK